MSKRIDLVYLGDMLDAARRVAAKVDGKTIGDFQTDDNLQLAVVHLIQVIGESASRVSAAIREENSTLPWDAVIGMRNRLVHDYGNVDYSIVWRVAVEEIPKLISVL
ncbi:MAG TPA: HepT-like ribonuclease domain-containing protein, partial [Thermoanaerobaculia bacterium]